MAQLSDVSTAFSDLSASITALSGRITPPAATAADLDGIVAQVNQAKAAIDGIAPVTP